MEEYKIRIINKNETTHHTFWANDDEAAIKICLTNKGATFIELYKDDVKIADI